MREVLGLIQPRLRVLFALAVLLAGSQLALPASAQVLPYTISAAVVPSDPGPFVGRVCLTGSGVCEIFADVQEDGSFSATYPLDFTFRLPPRTTFLLRVDAFDPYHHRKQTPIEVDCAFGPAGWSCAPTPAILILVASAYGNLEGSVRDGSGQPVEGAVVEAVGPRQFPGTATTNAAGHFRYPVFDPALPMFGPRFPFQESEPDSREYEIRVLSMPSGGPLPAAQRVPVSRGVLARVDFGPTVPPENRPREIAQGPPTSPEACLGYIGRPVNVTTGNMYTQQEDLAHPSAFGRLAFTRTYNSQSTYTGPLGLGWTHPFDFELKELRPGVIHVRNGAGNGRFYELVSGSTDTYRPAAPARDTSMLVKYAGGFTETERSGLRREFDSGGRVLAAINRAGWQITFTYSDGLLATVTDPGGRTLSFSYADGKLTRVEGPGGLFSTYSYDTQSQLVSVADALGTRWTYTYGDSSPPRLTSVRDANGNVVEEHTYDDEGRVIFTRGAGGLQARTLEYVDGSTTRVTDSLGRVTAYTFGVFGDQPLITRIEGPCPCGGPDGTFEYDVQGRRVRQTDAQGHAAAFEYDADGNLVKVSDAFGQVTTLTYNAFGQVLTTTDPTGAATTFTYEEITGFLLQVTNALGHTTTLAADPNNLPGAVTDPRGNRTSFTYASTGLLSAATDPAGAATITSYDPAGRPLETRDALGGTILSTYDLRGRLFTVTDPLGAVTQFRYDLAGNRVGLTDPNGRVTSYTYDAANRLIAVTDASGGTTGYSYDTEGNLLSITDTQAHATAFAYDGHNRLVTRTDPLGKAETFAYDAAGNLVSRTDRKGQTVTYAYDGLNRLTQKTLPDGTTVTYTYDPLGRLLSATDLNEPLAFTYDDLGRVLTATSQDGRTLTYSYDPAGNRVGLQDETGHVTSYTYDPRNLLATLTDPRTGAYGFGYDALGRRTHLTRPNGTMTTYGYDAASRVVGLTHRGRNSPFEALSYSYDRSGNRITDTRNETKHQYTYDPLNQLTQVQMRENRARWRVEEAYFYDAVGNRLTGPDGQGYQYDAANRLTQDRTHTYAYDGNGNLIQKVRLRDGRVTTYSYDPEDRLIRVVTPRTEVTFQYDPLGRRTERRVIRWEDEDGDHEPDPEEGRPPRVTRYLYDHEDILATSNDSGRESARYTHGPGIDEPLAEVRRHHTRFYHADGLGSVIALTGEHGHRVRDYRYSAFGVPADHRGDAQPYRFTGREWDKEIDLYYYRARYYHPQVGRFMREDPIGFAGGDSNLYRYALNDPINSVDPYGLLTIPGYGWVDLGESAGAEALSFYADFINTESYPLWARAAAYVPAFFAALWTPCESRFGVRTSNLTSLTLATGYAAGRYLGRPYWQYYPEGNPGYPSSWLTRGWGGKPPFNVGSEAGSRLSLPPYNPGTAVRPVAPSPWKFVGGPTRVPPQYGHPGGGWQYRIGSWP